MRNKAFSWSDRFPEEELTCVRCLESKPKPEFDRLLWCESCRTQARARAARIGWVGGAVMTLIICGYLWATIRPSGLIPQLWLGALVAVFWLGARFVREIAFGAMRYRNDKAVEARPPDSLD